MEVLKLGTDRKQIVGTQIMGIKTKRLMRAFSIWFLNKRSCHDENPSLYSASYRSRTMTCIVYPSLSNDTWHGFACIRFCSRVSLVPPITTWTPIEGWYFNRLLASAAAWLASSRVGQMTSTTIGVRFWSRSTGGNFTTTSIAGSWNWDLKHKYDQMSYMVSMI